MPWSHKAPWGGLNNLQVLLERVPALELDAVIASPVWEWEETEGAAQRCGEGDGGAILEAQRENEVFLSVPGLWREGWLQQK